MCEVFGFNLPKNPGGLSFVVHLHTRSIFYSDACKIILVHLKTGGNKSLQILALKSAIENRSLEAVMSILRIFSAHNKACNTETQFFEF